MANIITSREPIDQSSRNLVQMNWDPITRIVGNLGIYTKIDFDNREVVECKSTSSMFRGYSVFMKGKDPRDSHFITSRICGICGDNHATCSVYAQNMAYGIKMPEMAEWIYNLGEAAEYMFDHAIYQDNLVFVDFCEKMVKETNPTLLEKAEKTLAPNSDIHGHRTIADIMRSFNPFEGAMYKEALQMSRVAREMFCLMEGRHVHPSTLYPGGTGTMPTPQLFTDYLSRLIKFLDFAKKAVPLNDDLFDFFYEALPGYEEVGRRRVMLGCWGSFQDPDVCDYKYKNMTEWGRAMFVTPGIVVDGELITTDLIEINLGMRILLGSSYYEDWENEEVFVKNDPVGNPVDKRHPWNQTTIPKPQKRDLEGGNYSWVMSPRWYDKRTGDYSAARYWRRPDCAFVGDGAGRFGGYAVCEIDRTERENQPAQINGFAAGNGVRVEDSQVVERHRTRPRAHLFHRLCSGDVGVFLRESDGAIAQGRHENLSGFRGARRSHRLRFPRSRARRFVASHGDSRWQNRQLSSLSTDAVERQSARLLRHAGAV